MRKLDVIAIDPGDVHVGVALWLGEQEKMVAAEWSNEQAARLLQKLLHRRIEANHGNVRLVIEEFRLYPDKAGSQSYSPMATAELIGVMKWIAGGCGVPVSMQGASIKVPTRAQCKARGIDTDSKRGGHATDAVLHAWHWLLRSDTVDTTVNLHRIAPNRNGASVELAERSDSV